MSKKLLLIVLITLCWSSVAMATDLSFTPPPGEHSLKYLSDIFGNMGPNQQWTKATTESPFIKMFDVFNHAILIFGIVVILYTTIVASVNTAYHGKMMGDKWSSLWVPIRVVIGFALLIPQGNGYAIIQSLVMWLVIQSVGAANSLWNVMVDNMAALHREDVAGKTVDEQIPTSYKPSQEVVYGLVDRVVRPMFRALVCQHFYARNFPDYNVKDGIIYTQSTPPGTKVTITFKGTKDLAQPYSVNCGTITIAQYDDSTDGKKMPDAVKKGLVAEQEAVLKDMINTLMPLAKQTAAIPVAFEYKAAVTELNKLGMTASTGVATVVDKYVQRMFTFWRSQQTLTSDATKMAADKLKQEGWIYAGSYYMLLSQRGDANKRIGVQIYYPNIVPTVQMPGAGIDIVTLSLNAVVDKFERLYNKTGDEPSDVAGRVQLNADRVIGFFSMVLHGINPPGIDDNDSLGRQAVANMVTYYQTKANMKEAFVPSDWAVTDSGGSAQVNAFWRKSIEDFMQLTQVDLVKTTEDPVVTLVNYGKASSNTIEQTVKDYQEKVRTWAIWDTIAQAASGGASGLAGGLAGGLGAPLSGMATGFASLATSLATIYTRIQFLSASAEATTVIAIAVAFFAQAVLIGIYLPLIPFIIFAFGVVGWFMIVIEAMVAAPIVALGATIPEGNEVYGKAVPALMLVANLFLRPALMLFGLYGAVLLSQFVIIFFTQGFDIVFGRLFGFTGAQSMYFWTVITFIYAALLVAILQRCFSLIGHLPDRVLRWIGDTSSGMGAAEEALGEAKGATSRGGEMGGQTGSGVVQSEKTFGEGVSTAAGQSASSAVKGGIDTVAGGKNTGKWLGDKTRNMLGKRKQPGLDLQQGQQGATPPGPATPPKKK